MVRESVSLPAVVADALALVRPTCVHVGIDLAYQRPSEPLFVRGDAEALHQLVINLVLNAVAAVNSSCCAAKIIVELERWNNDCAALHVRDTGPGPAAEVADRLFEPFVSGKCEGTGLGLYVARQVAEDHQGSISWQRLDGETCFSVLLPLFPPAPVSAP